MIKRPKALNINLSYFFLAVAAILFISGVGLKLDAPLTAKDQVSYLAAEKWSAGLKHVWAFDHPPGEAFLLAGAFRIFGEGIAAVYDDRSADDFFQLF